MQRTQQFQGQSRPAFVVGGQNGQPLPIQYPSNFDGIWGTVNTYGPMIGNGNHNNQHASPLPDASMLNGNPAMGNHYNNGINNNQYVPQLPGTSMVNGNPAMGIHFNNGNNYPSSPSGVAVFNGYNPMTWSHPYDGAGQAMDELPMAPAFNFPAVAQDISHGNPMFPAPSDFNGALPVAENLQDVYLDLPEDASVTLFPVNDQSPMTGNNGNSIIWPSPGMALQAAPVPAPIPAPVLVPVPVSLPLRTQPGIVGGHSQMPGPRPAHRRIRELAGGAPTRTVNPFQRVLTPKTANASTSAGSRNGASRRHRRRRAPEPVDAPVINLVSPSPEPQTVAPTPSTAAVPGDAPLSPPTSSFPSAVSTPVVQPHELRKTEVQDGEAPADENATTGEEVPVAATVEVSDTPDDTSFDGLFGEPGEFTDEENALFESGAEVPEPQVEEVPVAATVEVSDMPYDTSFDGLFGEPGEFTDEENALFDFGEQPGAPAGQEAEPTTAEEPVEEHEFLHLPKDFFEI